MCLYHLCGEGRGRGGAEHGGPTDPGPLLSPLRLRGSIGLRRGDGGGCDDAA